MPHVHVPGSTSVAIVCLVLMTVPLSAGQRWVWGEDDPQDRQGPLAQPDRIPSGSAESLDRNENPDLRYPGGDSLWPLGPPALWLWPRPPNRTRRPSSTRPQTTPSTTTIPSTTTVNPASLVDVKGSPVNCTCLTTHQFNPVCGTNGATYNSPIKLRCAQRCGYDVEISHYGSCPRRTTSRK